MATLPEKVTKFYLSFLIMEIYYTKKEYNEMKNRLTKQLNTANAKIAKLEEKVKELKKDYDVLLETATESSRNEE